MKVTATGKAPNAKRQKRNDLAFRKLRAKMFSDESRFITGWPPN